MIKHRGRCSLKYSNSSCDAPGQLVSSNSCKWRNCIRLERPDEVNRGHPANDRTCKLRIEHKCCNPKSRTCEHQRKNNAVNESIVDM